MAASAPVAVGTLLEARGVSHSFRLPNGSAFHVLENVSLAVLPGEVVALLGPSGCGKSTLLRILAGLVTPTAGEVFYHGRGVKGLTPGVAIVFQSFALYPWLTVLDNVRVVLEAAGLPEGERRSRAEKAIRTVGLAGFEEAYPRELSGGMKQRLGMARALSIEPEILFMDEPFSHVDALTAESLRAEVIDLWLPEGQNPSSIVMVSHDIKEVVTMADRIVVLATNPGRIGRIVENRLPRPRDARSRPFEGLVDELHAIITGAELPEETATPTPEIVPLPAASADEVAGLLEHLDANDGVDEIFRIAAHAHQEFGRVIAVVKAAEMLDFVDTPQQGVVLTRPGRDFVRGDTDARKRIWREQVLKLRLFHDVHDRLAARPEHTLDASEVHEMITAALPHEHYETIFDTLVRWAQFGNLFAYDEATERLSLQ